MAMAMACTTICNTAPAFYSHSFHSLPRARSHNTSVCCLNSFSSSLFANREVRTALKSQFRSTDQFVASSALATMASAAEKSSASEVESKPFGVLFVCLGKMLPRNWALLLLIYLIYTSKNWSELNNFLKVRWYVGLATWKYSQQLSPWVASGWMYISLLQSKLKV